MSNSGNGSRPQARAQASGAPTHPAVMAPQVPNVAAVSASRTAVQTNDDAKAVLIPLSADALTEVNHCVSMLWNMVDTAVASEVSSTALKKSREFIIRHKPGWILTTITVLLNASKSFFEDIKTAKSNKDLTRIKNLLRATIDTYRAETGISTDHSPLNS